MEVDDGDATTMEVDSTRGEARSKKRKREASDAVVDFTPRTLRDSTKSKTAEADVQRQEREKQEKMKAKVFSRPEKPTFIQKELLKEALTTEVKSITVKVISCI